MLCSGPQEEFKAYGRARALHPLVLRLGPSKEIEDLTESDVQADCDSRLAAKISAITVRAEIERLRALSLCGAPPSRCRAGRQVGRFWLVPPGRADSADRPSHSEFER